MNIDIFFFVLVILGLISIHVYCFLRERSTLYITVFLDIVVGGLSILAITNHPLFKDWMQEDAWVEWATFYVFIGAGLLFFFCLLRGSNDPNKRNPLVLIGTLILSVFCFLVAAEEISWGQRLFAFKPPDLFLEMNFQQELNIHNIFKKKELAGVPLDSRYLVAFTAIFYGIILAVMPHIFKRGRLAEAISVVAPPIFLAPWFVIVAYVEITYPVKLAGEAAEFVLGLLFLIVAFTLYRSSESSQKNMIRFRNFKVIVVVMIPIILGLITPSILQATLFSKKTGNIV